MLTDKQIRFIREYLRAPNDPTGAALRAGYSPGRARRQAREMLERPEVRERLQSARADAAAEEVSPARVIRELARIAFADPAEMLGLAVCAAPVGRGLAPAGTEANSTLVGVGVLDDPHGDPAGAEAPAPPVGVGVPGAPLVPRRVIPSAAEGSSPGRSAGEEDPSTPLRSAQDDRTGEAGQDDRTREAEAGEKGGTSGGHPLQGGKNPVGNAVPKVPHDDPDEAAAPFLPLLPTPASPPFVTPGSGTGLKLKYTPKRAPDGSTVFELSMEREVRIGDKLRALEMLLKFLGVAVPPSAGDDDSGDGGAGLIVLPEVEE